MHEPGLDALSDKRIQRKVHGDVDKKEPEHDLLHEAQPLMVSIRYGDPRLNGLTAPTARAGAVVEDVLADLRKREAGV